MRPGLRAGMGGWRRAEIPLKVKDMSLRKVQNHTLDLVLNFTELFRICLFFFIHEVPEPLSQSTFVSLLECLPQKHVGTRLFLAQNFYCKGQLALYDTTQTRPRSVTRTIELKKNNWIL